MSDAWYTTIGETLSFVERSGAGPDVLCLHTAGQSAVQWRHVLPTLARVGFRVTAPDLPGHGRSEPAPRGPVCDLGDYVSWCRSLIGALGLHRPIVVGCSIGGKIALQLGADHGRELTGVVAMAADARNGSLSIAALERELQDTAAPARSDRTQLGTLASVGRAVAAPRAQLIAEMHRREDPVVSVSDLIAWSRHDLRDRLATIACPVHLVAGEDDPWVSPADVEWAAAQIPGARYSLLDGIGHYPMEELEDFAELLATWVGELMNPSEPAMVSS